MATIKYRLIMGVVREVGDIRKFESSVDEALNLGWKCLGGVAVDRDTFNIRLIQTLVKEEN